MVVVVITVFMVVVATIVVAVVNVVMVGWWLWLSLRFLLWLWWSAIQSKGMAATWKKNYHVTYMTRRTQTRQKSVTQDRNTLSDSDAGQRYAISQ